MPISYSETYKMNCADCQAHYRVEVWMIIDAVERPDLWEYCRNDSIHTASCPNGHSIYLGAPLLLHDPANRRVLFSPFSPSQQPATQQDIHKAVNYLMPKLLNALPPAMAADYARAIQIVPRESLRIAIDEQPVAGRPAVSELNEEAQLMAMIDAPAGPKDMPERIQRIEEALQKVTRSKNPGGWAWLQSRLGTSYAKSSVGDLAENLERAIEAFRSAMAVYTRQESPEAWADQQINLATVYGMRVRGNRAENLAKSVEASKAALSVYTRENAPDRWETAQGNLKKAESELLLEENPKLKHYLRTKFPSHAQTKPDAAAGERARSKSIWPEEQPTGRLKSIFAELASLDKAPGSEHRARLMREAIQFIDPVAYPAGWATLQFGLGNYLMEDLPGSPRESLEQAIEAYEAALTVFGQESYPGEWSSTNNNLAGVYMSLARYGGGEKHARAENLERAVDTYRRMIDATDRATSEAMWAELHYNLGISYAERVIGDPVQNLEESVKALQSALSVFSFESDPRRWADIQYNIGTIYEESSGPNRVENYELALRAYKEALKVYTPQLFRLEWAETQARLGKVYCWRLTGNEENFELSIKAYEAALTVFTREGYPDRWADIQLGLAEAYQYREQGDESENKELALEACRAALSIYDPHQSPDWWARAQTKLGVAYFNRRNGDAQENLKRSIRAYQAALNVQTREANPKAWAHNQGELALAYMRASWYWDKAENLERAIDAYEAAFTVYTGESFKESWEDGMNWAVFQSMLGNVYRQRVEGDRAENLDLAIKAYEAALTVFKDETYPGRRPLVVAQLAEAYVERIRGERKENLERAAGLLQAALGESPETLFSRDSFGFSDQVWFIASRYAEVQVERQDWPGAYSALQLALKAANQLYTTAVTEEARAKEIKRNESEYQMMVDVCLRLDPPRPLDAFLYAEQGRSRLLRDQLSDCVLPAPRGVPQSVVTLERQLMERLRILMSAPAAPASERLAPQPGATRRDVLNELTAVRKRLGDLWDTLQRKHYADDYVALRRGEQVDWDDVQRWLSSQGIRTGLLEFFAINQSLVAFVIREGDLEPRVVPINISLRRLEDFGQRLVSEVHRYDPRLSFAETWRGLSPLLLKDVMPHLAGLELLYIIPHGILHNLPLHALEYEGKPLIEYFPIAYAPSVSVALRVAPPAGSATPGPGGAKRKCLVVGDPTVDLPFAEQEARAVAERFGVRPLIGKEATIERVKRELAATRQAHLATHASFVAGDPFASGIDLAGGDKLTARDLLTLSLEAELVVLSACQTGMQEVQPGDELMGLARALLYAGAPSLVLSLWAVHDTSTKELMLGFYSCLYDESGVKKTSVTQALRAAMLDIRASLPATYYWAPFALFGDWR